LRGLRRKAEDFCHWEKWRLEFRLLFASVDCVEKRNAERKLDGRAEALTLRGPQE
jgi:hypothetical protein